MEKQEGGYVEWDKVAEALDDLEGLGYLYPEVEEIAQRMNELLNPRLRAAAGKEDNHHEP